MNNKFQCKKTLLRLFESDFMCKTDSRKAVQLVNFAALCYSPTSKERGGEIEIEREIGEE